MHEVEIISVDAVGADLRTKTRGDCGVVRVGFRQKVSTIDQTKAAFTDIIAEFQAQRKRQN